MSGWTAALLSVVLVVNPIGVSRAVAWPDRGEAAWRRSVAEVAALVLVVLVGLGLLTAPILELIDVTTPTFRLTAALVMGIAGLVWMIRPTAPITETADSPLVTVGLTLLLTPGPVFAAMAANGDGGTVAGIVAVAVAVVLVAVALVEKRPSGSIGTWATQMIGAGALFTAIAIGLDAARTV